MIRMLRLVFVTIIGWATLGANEAEQEARQFEQLWFAGTVDAAFAKAKQEKRRVFLYWGAVWCPPCNELKSNVFNTSEFKQRMQQVVPVYIDGDAPSAQALADRFQVSGYPTLVLLAANGDELFRINESVSIAEFTRAFDAAILIEDKLEVIVARALAGKASRDDWRLLAYYSWSPGASLGQSRLELLRTWQDLQARIPTELIDESAIFAARILGLAVSEIDANDKKKSLESEYSQIKNKQSQLLQLIFADDNSIAAARNLLLYSPQEVIDWLHPSAGAPARKTLIKRWSNALATLQRRTDLSINEQLWLANAKASLFALDSPGKKLPPALKAELLGAIASADNAASSPFARHAVIADAASMLAKYDELAKARTMLLAEIKTTDTPWYYWSMLSSIEKQAGNTKQALEYSSKARLSATGDATKLQWLVNDLLFRLKTEPNSSTLPQLVDSYYQLVFSLPDSFAGRNKSRADRVAEELHKKINIVAIKDQLIKYSMQCAKLSEAAKSECDKHFKTVL